MPHSRPAAKLALDSDMALSLFYLIEVLMSVGSASATLSCKKKGGKIQKIKHNAQTFECNTGLGLER